MKKNASKKKTTKGRSSKTGIKVPKNTEVVRSIGKLHKEIVHSIKISLKNGIAIGGILEKVKKELGHKNWGPWIKAYLPFSQRTATNYMSLFKHRKEIKTANVSDLQTAYRLISDPEKHHMSKARLENTNRRIKFANKKSNFKNPKNGKYENSVIAGDNYKVMQEMLSNGMARKYSGVVTSNPYNAGFHYSDEFDDDKPYDIYLKETLKPFKLFPKLLRKGARVVYIIGGVVRKKDKSDNSDYNYQIIDDLKAGVKKVAPKLRFLNQIIWDKSGRKNPLNKKWGSFASPKAPMTRSCFENILIWANEEFELENIENTTPDISQKEFEDWSWNVWKIAPYVTPGNPHPCSFPPKLIERVLKFYTYPNDLILDPYSGACITAKICKRLRRRFTCIDLNPNYCEYGAEQLKSA